ncbi:glycosyltransferase involved in cell wall biosynthesis [Algoriphagus boseongensis]|uniref:Glycosyltransferase involved in cell wall biosynthesis n=1 Tax=Algoriphagus boseongensis TaxID=1442587 RepID=A0A4R6TAW9_9BACT|nr:glycosyltransferase [Algoriphagus boseongensis]TDQ19373.1 glycosyltransferase involved in cell wall biosynthesis [Algoriphagus boseongensis]
MNVAHVIVNNLGGITSLVQNLVLYKGKKALPQELVVLDIKNNPNQKALLDTEVEKITRYFPLNPLDNWYYTYGKLAKMLSEGEGILVSNDQYDLIMLQAFNIPRKVVQLVHDPYNVELSLKFHDVIDHFITHSCYIYDILKAQLPHRATDLTYVPYGIPLHPPVMRELRLEKSLKTVFLGRHDKAKGVYDLYEIDRILKEWNVQVDWLILGKGPETGGLHQQWNGQPHVVFETPATYTDLMTALGSADVMVFPTKFEGFPVALLECMSRGCVPVVTDLPGGIRELVEDGITGFKCPINSNEEFAAAVEKLHHNRALLLQMQNNASHIVFELYNAVHQSPSYQQVFHTVAVADSVPRHHTVNRKIGSRLDQPFFPNIITSLIRRMI